MDTRIKMGDRVTVEFTVCDTTSGRLLIGSSITNEEMWIARSEVVTVVPRPVRAGDKGVLCSGVPVEVLHVHGDKCATVLEDERGWPCVVSLKSLTRIDK